MARRSLGPPRARCVADRRSAARAGGLFTYEGIEGAWSARPSAVHRVFFAVRDPVVAAGRRAGAAGASPGDAVLVLGAGARRAWSALSPQSVSVSVPF